MHLHLMAFWPTGKETNLHVLLLTKTSYLFYIEAFYSRIFKAYFHNLGAKSYAFGLLILSLTIGWQLTSGCASTIRGEDLKDWGNETYKGLEGDYVKER